MEMVLRFVEGGLLGGIVGIIVNAAWVIFLHGILAVPPPPDWGFIIGCSLTAAIWGASMTPGNVKESAMRKFDPFEPIKPYGAGEQIGECSRCGGPVYAPLGIRPDRPVFSCTCQLYAEQMRGMQNSAVPAKDDQ